MLIFLRKINSAVVVPVCTISENAIGTNEGVGFVVIPHLSTKYVDRYGAPSLAVRAGVGMRMMNEFEAQVLGDLCVLKTHMSGLVGDGASGRIYELERRVERHELNLQRAKGFMAAMSVLMAMVEVAVEAFRRH